ncbi:class I SAM-dependent methyltransferase [Qipengyuania sp. DGS5-3]|uniref:class I SAM-dependent methyltransferase n=1 Tax=Qipengyuania sp. DGS5-3 TaxID=3349632 RepID=UPI0036D42566
MTSTQELLARFERLSSGILTSLPEGERETNYDHIAPLYDLVVGNGIYNRLIWGCPKRAYRDAATTFFERVQSGPIIDFGCGSLVFTAASYRGEEDHTVLFDLSRRMLERGQKRLPSGHFLQGDALDPPFDQHCFAGAMSWGMLHIFGTGAAYLSRLKKVVKPGGVIALGTLVLADRALGDRWLHALYKRGEAAAPQTVHQVTKGFEQYFTLESSELCGNMLFLFGHRGYT